MMRNALSMFVIAAGLTLTSAGLQSADAKSAGNGLAGPGSTFSPAGSGGGAHMGGAGHMGGGSPGFRPGGNSFGPAIRGPGGGFAINRPRAPGAAYVRPGYPGKLHGNGQRWSENRGGDWNNRHRGDRDHRHHHHRYFISALPYYAYDYGYDYGSYGGYQCEWLHRQAIRTDSSYWWNRYYDCID